MAGAFQLIGAVIVVLPVVVGLRGAFPAAASPSNERGGRTGDYSVKDREQDTRLNAADETRNLLPSSPRLL